MSSCLIIQEKNRLFIGADSAISVKYNDKYLRYNNDGEKLYKIKNEILFISGNMELAEIALFYYKNVNNIFDFSDKLKEICENYKSNNIFNLEIMIAGTKNDSTYVYQISEYNKFYPKLYTVDNNCINVLCGGLSTEKLNNIVIDKIKAKNELHKIFLDSYKEISNENIGGKLTVYEVNVNTGINVFFKSNIDNYINNVFNTDKKNMHLLVADTIVGRLLLSEKLIVSNPSGTYTIDENGMIAKNGSYQVKINPNNPSEIFAIAVDGTNLLYIDTSSKKLKFEGDIESKSGHIANYTISTNDLISGNVGMSSNTSSGAIAFWAGNTNRNSAPFRVSNTGVLTASSVYITGGQLNIGNGNFTVNSSGILTAKSANISGTVTATSGKIGNWVIENGSLKGEGDARLYVQRDGSTFFMVNNARIALGGFEVTYTSRDIFQSYDEYTGLSANPDDNSKFCLWGGYTGGTVTNTRNYAICVNGGGQTYTKELHANYIYGVAGDSDTSDGWTIGEYLDWIYGELDSTSDKTAKDNITDIDNEEALNLILKSKPVTFQYKTTGQWSAGFIAQDVDTLQDELEVYYPLTGYNDKSEKYKIYYRTYIPLLVSCIQNLQNQINELKGININEENNIEINNTDDTEIKINNTENIETIENN